MWLWLSEAKPLPAGLPACRQAGVSGKFKGSRDAGGKMNGLQFIDIVRE